MTLADRARRAAVARPAGTLQRAIVIAIALALVGAGIRLEELVAVAVGAFLLGYEFRPEAERYYMEGFANGIAAAAELEAADRAADRDRDRAGLRPVPAGPREALDPGAARVVGEAGSAAAAGAGPTTLEDALGVGLEPRSARSSVDADGSPLPIGEGPRRAPFPVPAATPSRSPVDIRAARSANGRRTRSKRAQ